MNVQRVGSQASAKGPAEWFTGVVRIDPLFQAICPGDVVWFAPGEKHWHGATPTTAMTHIAIQEKLNGKVVDWMEHVTGEQYRKPDCA